MHSTLISKNIGKLFLIQKWDLSPFHTIMANLYSSIIVLMLVIFLLNPKLDSSTNFWLSCWLYVFYWNTKFSRTAVLCRGVRCVTSMIKLLAKWLNRLLLFTVSASFHRCLTGFYAIIHLVHTQNFLKTNILTPFLRTHSYVCVSGGKKCRFFGKFCVCINIINVM